MEYLTNKNLLFQLFYIPFSRLTITEVFLGEGPQRPSVSLQRLRLLLPDLVRPPGSHRDQAREDDHTVQTVRLQGWGIYLVSPPPSAEGGRGHKKNQHDLLQSQKDIINCDLRGTFQLLHTVNNKITPKNPLLVTINALFCSCS